MTHPHFACTTVLVEIEKKAKVASWQVVDFSGYKADWVRSLFQDVLGELQTQAYVFISTDSVYEVCEGAEEREERSATAPPIQEHSAKWPRQKEMRRRLKKR